MAATSGCYLLAVVAEPATDEDKSTILKRFSKGLLSWDATTTGCDLQTLQEVCKNAQEKEMPESGMLIQYSTEGLGIEVLVNPPVSTLKQCVKNLLTSTISHKHIIHSGYTFTGTGSWILQNGAYTFDDILSAFQDPLVHREKGCTIHVHCEEEGDWTSDNFAKEAFAKVAKLSLNPPDKMDHLPGSEYLVDCLDAVLNVHSLTEIMEASSLVGNIRFNRPTLYLFPAGQGDCALFGINGFNMLVDGGFNRKPCAWEFIRHLDRLDAVLVTRLSESNLCSMSTLMKRKTLNNTYPQIGYVFCNIAEGKNPSPSEETQKDKDSLLVSVVGEGHNFIQTLNNLKLIPHQCWSDNTSDPFVLYHKVGHGTLEMYVLSPPKDSKEMRDFLEEWSSYKEKFSCVKSGVTGKGKESMIPLSHVTSICAVVVWRPNDPKDTITRILFPGSAPQSKIFEGLEKLKNLDILKHPRVTKASLSAVIISKPKAKSAAHTIKATPPNRKNTASPALSTSSVASRNGDINGPKKDVKVATKEIKTVKKEVKALKEPKKENKAPKEVKKEVKEPKQVSEKKTVTKAAPRKVEITIKSASDTKKSPPLKKVSSASKKEVSAKPSVSAKAADKPDIKKAKSSETKAVKEGIKKTTDLKSVAKPKAKPTPASTKSPAKTKPTPVPKSPSKITRAIAASAAVAAAAVTVGVAEFIESKQAETDEVLEVEVADETKRTPTPTEKPVPNGDIDEGTDAEEQNDIAVPASPTKEPDESPALPTEEKNEEIPASQTEEQNEIPASPTEVEQNEIPASPVKDLNEEPPSPMEEQNEIPVSQMKEPDEVLASPMEEQNEIPASPVRQDLLSPALSEPVSLTASDTLSSAPMETVSPTPPPQEALTPSEEKEVNEVVDDQTPLSEHNALETAETPISEDVDKVIADEGIVEDSEDVVKSADGGTLEPEDAPEPEMVNDLMTTSFVGDSFETLENTEVAEDIPASDQYSKLDASDVGAEKSQEDIHAEDIPKHSNATGDNLEADEGHVTPDMEATNRIDDINDQLAGATMEGSFCPGISRPDDEGVIEDYQESTKLNGFEDELLQEETNKFSEIDDVQAGFPENDIAEEPLCEKKEIKAQDMAASSSIAMPHSGEEDEEADEHLTTEDHEHLTTEDHEHLTTEDHEHLIQEHGEEIVVEHDLLNEQIVGKELAVDDDEHLIEDYGKSSEKDHDRTEEIEDRDSHTSDKCADTITPERAISPQVDETRTTSQDRQSPFAEHGLEKDYVSSEKVGSFDIKKETEQEPLNDQTTGLVEEPSVSLADSKNLVEMAKPENETQAQAEVSMKLEEHKLESDLTTSDQSAVESEAKLSEDLAGKEPDSEDEDSVDDSVLKISAQTHEVDEIAEDLTKKDLEISSHSEKLAEDVHSESIHEKEIYDEKDHDSAEDGEDEMIRHPSPPGSHEFYSKVGPTVDDEMRDPIGQHFIQPTLFRGKAPEVASEPLYEEEDSGSERGPSPVVVEQPVFGETDKADFPELVTVSGGTTPSEPQSPKSPLDSKKGNTAALDVMEALSEHECSEGSNQSPLSRDGPQGFEADNREFLSQSPLAHQELQQHEYDRDVTDAHTDTYGNVPSAAFDEHKNGTYDSEGYHQVNVADIEPHPVKPDSETISVTAEVHSIPESAAIDQHLDHYEVEAEKHSLENDKEKEYIKGGLICEDEVNVIQEMEGSQADNSSDKPSEPTAETHGQTESDYHYAPESEIGCLMRKDHSASHQFLQQDDQLQNETSHEFVSRPESDQHLGMTAEFEELDREKDISYMKKEEQPTHSEPESNCDLEAGSVETETKGHIDTSEEHIMDEHHTSQLPPPGYDDASDEASSSVKFVADSSVLSSESRVEAHETHSYEQISTVGGPDASHFLETSETHSQSAYVCGGETLESHDPITTEMVSMKTECVEGAYFHQTESKSGISIAEMHDDMYACPTEFSSAVEADHGTLRMNQEYVERSRLDDFDDDTAVCPEADQMDMNALTSSQYNQYYPNGFSDEASGVPEPENAAKVSAISAEYTTDDVLTTDSSGKDPADWKTAYSSDMPESSFNNHMHSEYSEVSTVKLTEQEHCSYVTDPHYQSDSPEDKSMKNDSPPDIPSPVCPPESATDPLSALSKDLPPTYESINNKFVPVADDTDNMNYGNMPLPRKAKFGRDTEDPYGQSSDDDDSSSLPGNVSPYAYTNKAYNQGEDADGNHIYKPTFGIEQGIGQTTFDGNNPQSYPESSIPHNVSPGMTYSPGFPDMHAADPNYDFRLEEWGKPMGLPTPPESLTKTTKKPVKAPVSSKLANKVTDKRPSLDNGKSPGNVATSKLTASPVKKPKESAASEGKPVYVDLAYVPHHGDLNYSGVEYFKRIRARYYVFSGISPSREVLNALLEAKKTWKENLEVTIIPTYETDALGYWMAQNQEMLAEYSIDVAPSASRCTVNLQDHETSCAAYRLEF